MALVNGFNVNNTPVKLDADIIENMSANDVSYNDSVQYNENTVGSKLSELELKTDQQGIYDVSAHNNGAVFESLSSLLNNDNLSTLIPASVRCGGMSIRFIQGTEPNSDNKYVQYRLMSNVWTTTVADWQGVDDKPTAGSDNLVKSGGVADAIENIIDNVSAEMVINYAAEEQVWCNDDETEEYAKIGKEGVKAKAYLDLDGNPIQVGKEITTKKIVCLRNGIEGQNCDYAGLNAIHRALESIKDNDYYHRYVIIVKGHFVFNQVCFTEDGTDVTKEYWTSVTGATTRDWVGHGNEWLANVYGKDYVTIDGGDKNKTSIEVYLKSDTEFPLYPNNLEHYNGTNIHVLFNACHWAEFRNITFVGYNTRYALHTENASSSEESYARYYNCKFVYKKDHTWTRDDGTQKDTYNASDTLGLGFRAGYNWVFDECELYNDGNGNCLGGHSGFKLGEIKNKVNPAIVTLNNCQFQSKKAIGMSTYYELADAIHLNNCNFKIGSTISVGLAYLYVNNLEELCNINIYSNGKHLAYSPGTNNVIKITNGSSVNKVVVCQTSSAFCLFSSTTFDEDQLMPVERNFDGSYNFNGYIAKYGNSYGYIIGKRPISMDKDKNITLGKLLGDCTTENKELSLYIDDILVSKNFSLDYSEMSDDDVLSEINNLFIDTGISFSLFNKSLTEEMVCGFSEEVLNVGAIPLQKYMGVVFQGSGVRAAKSGETIDGISISYLTPVNSYARICTKGEFKNIYGISSVTNGKYYKIGSNDGEFIVSENESELKAINNIIKFK